VVIPFPLSCIGSGTSVFNLLPTCDDCTDETAGSAWETWFFGGGGGNGNDAVDQPWW
jgi:hypothetical protein